jgi:hypothetical protein
MANEFTAGHQVPAKISVTEAGRIGWLVPGKGLWCNSILLAVEPI